MSERANSSHVWLVAHREKGSGGSLHKGGLDSPTRQPPSQETIRASLPPFIYVIPQNNSYHHCTVGKERTENIHSFSYQGVYI